ncbi:12270_t:CDS:2 [Funneliformis caledonium]|uniref:12270_t:CDS:1 n=1 Tax=Funneliformis caledonium TaxID=1117310 RepID=A0A9N9BF31_9GLOM|nr:12270_t:CDS:2 [Funneliformis caledonium]
MSLILLQIQINIKLDPNNYQSILYNILSTILTALFSIIGIVPNLEDIHQIFISSPSIHSFSYIHDMFQITCEEKLPDQNNQNEVIGFHIQKENDWLSNSQNENEYDINQESDIPEPVDEIENDKSYNDSKGAPPCRWEKESTKILLAYLKENNVNVLLLESRGITANRVRETLWDGASKLWCKSEVEEILGKNRFQEP